MFYLVWIAFHTTPPIYCITANICGQLRTAEIYSRILICWRNNLLPVTQTNVLAARFSNSRGENQQKINVYFLVHINYRLYSITFYRIDLLKIANIMGFIDLGYKNIGFCCCFKVLIFFRLTEIWRIPLLVL